MKYCEDFSCYMTTGPLLKSAWLFAGESLGILVNTTKPSIRGLFAYGKMGRLHNVLFDMDCINLYSDKYGIYPYYRQNDKEYYPFRCGLDVRSDHSFDTSGNREISVLPEENTVTFRKLDMFATKDIESEGQLPFWSVSIHGDSLHLSAEFPQGAEECGIHLPWYPIYDTFQVGNNKKQKIQYYRNGIYSATGDHFCKDFSEPLTLEDTLSRQASVNIATHNGVVRLHSCTRAEYGNALYLSSDVCTTGTRLDVVITLLPPSAAISGKQYYPCNSDATISISEGGKHYTHTFRTASTPGVQTLQLDDKRVFTYCAVPDDREVMKRTADACRKIFWKEGILEGIPPYGFDPTTLEPILRCGNAYCSHGMRSLSSLIAHGVRSEDISYVDTAMHAIHQVEKISYHGEDGHIFTPLTMSPEGEASNQDACRPSDTGIIIRGIVQAAKAYLHFGETEKAKDCVILANNYSKILSKMQCADGGFFDRYYYPTAKPSVTNKGTVNNWCLQLWCLLPLLRYFDMEGDAARLETLIRNYIGYQIEKENSILYVSGGGEDASDFGDALNTDATLFSMQYILTGDPVWKDYAIQALKKSWLMSCMWADMPQYFGLYGNSDLGCFYDQPIGLYSAGGMHDLTAVEANLFAAEVLDSDFASDLADALHNGRLGSFIRENGGMYMIMFQCPGFFHRDERHSEMLMYGGVGVYAWHTAQKESQVLQRLSL